MRRPEQREGAGERAVSETRAGGAEPVSPLLRASGRAGLPPYAFVALLAGIALRLVLIFSAPVSVTTEGELPAFNDELAHLNHVRYRAEVGGAPPQAGSIHDEGALERGDFEYHQPPLFYELAALLHDSEGSLRERAIPIRLLNLLLWLLALGVIVRAAPEPRMRGPLLLAGGLLGAAFPSSATVSNDAMLALAAAAMHYMAGLAGERTLRGRELALLSLVLAAGFYAKMTTLLLLPMVLMAAGWNTVSPRRMVLRGLSVLGGTLVLTLPLWLTRLETYGSALAVEAASRGHTGAGPLEMVKAIVHSLVSPWPEFWSSPVVKGPAYLLPVVALMLLAYGWRMRGLLMLHLERTGSSGALILWGIGSLGVLAGWLWYGIAHGQMEPRLLLPGAPGIAVALGWPLWTLADPRAENRLGWGLFLLLLLPYFAWPGY